MAFNFNWSPLAADAEFYGRAKDLLTRALNKSPKPPIIVDDILVSDFNLGSVPPDLSILEIGDLADDRFRGIFKMCYSGDAFVTLKTRVQARNLFASFINELVFQLVLGRDRRIGCVRPDPSATTTTQANPMNTYVGSTSSFTSPQPLAAADGLTIPLSITLSNFSLSAFIIVVYSKHKGVTIVFRNDPLESLKVSSTFDSIQFVRDYLQTTIENQLRTLIMDELPTIIHRLSLQVLCHRTIRDDGEDGEGVINPLASPPSDPVDSSGNILDADEITALSLDEVGEPTFQFQSLFSHLNLLRLKKVAAAHEYLCTFTPSLRELHFRAIDSDSSESSGSTTPLTPIPGLVKSQSFTATSNTYSFSDNGSSANGHLPLRPSLVSLGSATTGLALGSGRARSYQTRKRKHRVVNLRRSKSEAGSETSSEAGDSPPTIDAVSVQDAMSEPLIHSSIPEDPEEETQLPIIEGVRTEPEPEKAPLPNRTRLTTHLFEDPKQSSESTVRATAPLRGPATVAYPSEKSHRPATSTSSVSDAPSVILEQAWIMKMAGEIARRVYDEKNRREGFWDEREDIPPPAYEASR